MGSSAALLIYLTTCKWWRCLYPPLLRNQCFCLGEPGVCTPTSTWKAETGGYVFKASLDYIEKFCLRKEQRDDGAENRGTREDRMCLRSSLSADSEGGWSQAIKASGDCAINMKAHSSLLPRVKDISSHATQGIGS